MSSATNMRLDKRLAVPANFFKNVWWNVNSMCLSGRWKYICGSREKTVTDAINDDKSKEADTYSPL